MMDASFMITYRLFSQSVSEYFIYPRILEELYRN